MGISYYQDTNWLWWGAAMLVWVAFGAYFDTIHPQIQLWLAASKSRKTVKNSKFVAREFVARDLAEIYAKSLGHHSLMLSVYADCAWEKNHGKQADRIIRTLKNNGWKSPEDLQEEDSERLKARLKSVRKKTHD